MADYTVSIGPFNMEAGGYMGPVLKEIAEKYKTNIMVTNPHGKAAPPTLGLPGDKINLFFWSYPRKGDSGKIEQVFDMKCTSGSRDLLLPEELLEEAEHLYFKERVIACTVERNVYILFDMPHVEYLWLTDNIGKFQSTLRQIMEWAMEQMESGGVNDETRLERAFIRTSEINLKAALDTETMQLTELESNIAEHYRMVQDLATRCSIKRDIVQKLRLQEQSLAAKAKQDLVSLKKISGLSKITTRGGILHIETKPIQLVGGEGVQYDIGEFTIDFARGVVYVVNKTRKVRGDLDHPHVKNKVVCYGATRINEYYANGDIVMAIHGILEILKTYNQGDAFESLDAWPVSKEPKDEELPVEVTAPTPRRRTRRTGSAHVRVLSEVLQADGSFAPIPVATVTEPDAVLVELVIDDDSESGDSDE